MFGKFYIDMISKMRHKPQGFICDSCTLTYLHKTHAQIQA